MKLNILPSLVILSACYGLIRSEGRNEGHSYVIKGRLGDVPVDGKLLDEPKIGQQNKAKKSATGRSLLLFSPRKLS